jgi:spore maturation protein CgeB
MRFVVVGLTLSSSWGNGHATTWRALLKALARGGHRTTFFERDVPYYRDHRDLVEPQWCELVLYPTWEVAERRLRRDLSEADVAILTSYCPDGLQAMEAVRAARVPCFAFYDIDTPVTIAQLRAQGQADSGSGPYLSAELVPEFDLYLSFTGGPTLAELETRWGARRAAALYCSVDPELHRPLLSDPELASDLSYLGTYSADRQPALEALLIEPARRHPDRRFAVAGAQYPPSVDWPANVRRFEHLPPDRHAAFYSSSTLNLNLTREAMVAAGFSPSVRLFEAAACGGTVVSDWWQGLETIFEPGREILLARRSEDVDRFLGLDQAEVRAIGAAARARVLAAHSSQRRADQLVELCQQVLQVKRG